MNRLIYKSCSVVPMSWDLVRDISGASEANNAACDVSGVLLASNTHFLQVLEGNFEDVNAVFRRICRDERHDSLSLVSFSVIDARLFSGWGMKGIGVFDLNENLQRQLIQTYGEEAGGVHFPLEEWQVLAMIQDIRLIRDLPDWKQ